MSCEGEFLRSELCPAYGRRQEFPHGDSASGEIALPTAGIFGNWIGLLHRSKIGYQFVTTDLEPCKKMFQSSSYLRSRI